ncbi:hypothetical protein [Dehalobacterium formicoaceticum]|uniref:Uncharacterized protein n=1 Tax=Dehalobacterium formicoaceticum TaxID=51515 RepID=A0ABT1Y1K3_9FIRM|nr:hypothetical protein [Dehalobacterium formicoaceticum]MCR6544744.1 hypothetical protein [Dehalobacterium formicoaceticum]
MKSMPKVKSLADLKSLINNHQGALSEGNVRIINEIIREMERSGGVNDNNRDRLKQLMNQLAQKNHVKVPKR